MGEQLLRQWGKRIAQTRLLRNAEGEIRRPGEPSMTQAQLAAHLGVRQATVSRWEAGKIEPKLEHKAELCDVLGVSMDALFGYPVAA